MKSTSGQRLIICRCEEISIEAIRAAIAEGGRTLNDIKRRTRAGMGICQGVFCAHDIARMIQQETGAALEELEPMTARPPARLVTLGPLADLTD